MDQQRNLIIAIALSIAILLGFEYFFGQRQLHPPAPATQTTAPTQPGTAAPAAPGPAEAAAAVKPRAAVLAEAPRVSIDTPRLKGSINLVGARVDDLTLANYHETIDPQSPPIELLSPDGAEHPYYVDFGDRKSTRLNSSHDQISYAVFCLKKKKHYKAIDINSITEVKQYIRNLKKTIE